MVTLIPRLPLSANSCAILLSNTKQSEPIMADATPSWLERGIASHVRRRRLPFNSRLQNYIKNEYKESYINLPVCKMFSLFTRSNELNNGIELCVPIATLLFFQDQYKMMTKTALNHNPIYSTFQVNFGSQKNNVFTI